MPATQTRLSSDAAAVRRLHDFGSWAPACYRILDKDGRIVPLRLNRAQRKLERAERGLVEQAVHAVRIYCLKGRQGGITTYQQAKNLHVMWSEPGSPVMTLAHIEKDTAIIFGMTRRAIDNFPAALLPRLGPAQTTQISFPGLDSHFWTGTAGATGVGRGITLRRLHGSEFAMWAEPAHTWGAFRPAMRPRSTVVLETTARGHGSEAHELWMASASPLGQPGTPGPSGFLQVFLPWWECDVENYRVPLEAPDELGKLEPEEAALVATHGLTLEQIKWRRREIVQGGRSWFLQEYAEDPNTCWMVAGGLFYDAERLKYLLDRKPEPKRLEHVHGERWSGHVEVYADQEGHAWERERVIIGADVAEGGGGDRSAYVARTFPAGRLLETFAASDIEPKVFAGLLCERGKKHDGALLVVEKNAHGITVLREARDSFRYPASRIYHREVFDRLSKRPTDPIGWVTTAQSHPILLDAGRGIINAACDGTYGVPSVHALTDAYAVQRDKKGDVSLNGKDVLVSEMLAWLGRTYQISGVGGFVANI